MTTSGDATNIHMIIANNSAWSNSNGGIHINGLPSVLATHNQWQSFDNANNAPLANGSGGNASAHPQLESGLQPIAPGAPVINSGTLTLPGGIGARDAQVITVTTNADTGSCPVRHIVRCAAH